MTENEKKVRLNEIGKEIAEMYPDLHGSMIFEFKNGKYMNKNSMNLSFSTKPK